MVTVLMLGVPFLALQALAGGGPMFTIGRTAKIALGVAVVLQILASVSWAPSRVAVPASFAIGVAVAWSIVRRSTASNTALWLVTAGGLANLAPIVLHGSMPVSRTALEGLGATGLAEPHWLAAKHRIGDPEGIVAALSDVVEVPGLAVISVGDVLILVGLIVMASVHRRSAGAERPVQGNRWRLAL